jgi:O-Antigen ligase
MRFLNHPSRWIFFSALVVAPWLYGGTTATSIVVINWLLGASLVLWVVELIVNRRLPQFPKLLIIAIAALLAIGAWMTINARSVYDPEFATFCRINNFAPAAPGSLDYANSLAWMIRAALLIGTVLFIVDLSQDNRALLQLWAVIAMSGGSIALLGLLQKATGAEAIFWQTPLVHYGSSFFASYYYHANAGAFLNLVLPLTAGFAVRAFGTESSPFMRAIWLLTFLVNLAAIAANTSRMAQLVGVLILAALLWQLGPRLYRRLSQSERNVALGGAAAMFVAIYAIAQTTHLEQPLRRWESLSGQASVDARWPVSSVALHALPDVGLFGFGPGTFRVAFPSYNNAAIQPLAGQWRFLHQDYLQTVMEWGWVGSAFWALLFFGGIASAVVALRRQRALRRGQGAGRGSQGANFTAGGRERFANRPREAGDSVLMKAERSEITDQTTEWSWRRRLILPLTIVALAGVAVHALVDFPLQIESIQVYVATYLGLCWGAAR